MSDAVTSAITTNITSPNSVSNDGVSVTNNRISEQVAGAKYLDGQNLLQSIADGTAAAPFVGFRMRPPGARGGLPSDDC